MQVEIMDHIDNQKDLIYMENMQKNWLKKVEHIIVSVTMKDQKI